MCSIGLAVWKTMVPFLLSLLNCHLISRIQNDATKERLLSIKYQYSITGQRSQYSVRLDKHRPFDSLWDFEIGPLYSFDCFSSNCLFQIGLCTLTLETILGFVLLVSNVAWDFSFIIGIPLMSNYTSLYTSVWCYESTPPSFGRIEKELLCSVLRLCLSSSVSRNKERNIFTFIIVQFQLLIPSSD